MRQTKLLAVVTILAALIPQTVGAWQANQGGAQKKEQKKDEGASLTGCVDQREGQYVLVNDRDLKVIANLEAQGFPIEGFAKHMGQKVTVRGTHNPDGARPVFKVRKVEILSETCTPQAAPAGRN